MTPAYQRVESCLTCFLVHGPSGLQLRTCWHLTPQSCNKWDRISPIIGEIQPHDSHYIKAGKQHQGNLVMNVKYMEASASKYTALWLQRSGWFLFWIIYVYWRLFSHTLFSLMWLYIHWINSPEVINSGSNQHILLCDSVLLSCNLLRKRCGLPFKEWWHIGLYISS